ncbi:MULTISPECIES: DUF1003 domain-containing protein [unclassified Paenibacillus]|uniref:DUF1003 domain-containing protein n=1 Tax=unclassified Paenibacillus TaxID=185978 RepID=UPI0009545B95|nr:MULTISPECIES: DUF1003 domain-containing protein [unclassified Paenibacillus]ASS65335.1 DUF1003 domain-containing protein [Paenibacillus sp. RUD330]SIQ39501.1 Uncharacterized membrane protein [Paenibacillus sp. RU4X]SIQ61683.1 Uncharacterized membrane protein [Paenibacillus sp. RU4T]
MAKTKDMDAAAEKIEKEAELARDDLSRYSSRLNGLVAEFEQRIHSKVNEEYDKTTRWPDKLADRIAQFGGSWRFIVIFFAVLALWIVINSLALTKAVRFDGPPFILLNLVLSFLAGFQAPIIMMSQNRQAARDKRESMIDYAINYKAELEIDDMQGHLHRLEADFASFRSETKRDMEEIKALLRSTDAKGKAD